MTIVSRLQMDNDARLLVELNPAQLKTIAACAVVRQAAMLRHKEKALDDRMYEIADAAGIEAEKSYRLGIYVEGILRSLTPDRIEDEWDTQGEFLVKRIDLDI